MTLTASYPDTEVLRYEPHRWRTTPAQPPQEESAALELGGITPSQMAGIEKAIAVALADWSARVNLENVQRLALLYAEFAVEDRQMAEAGLEDYERLLADADQ